MKRRGCWRPRWRLCRRQTSRWVKTSRRSTSRSVPTSIYLDRHRPSAVPSLKLPYSVKWSSSLSRSCPCETGTPSWRRWTWRLGWRSGPSSGRRWTRSRRPWQGGTSRYRHMSHKACQKSQIKLVQSQIKVHKWHFMRNNSHVTSQMSPVTCHKSHVTNKMVRHFKIERSTLLRSWIKTWM